MTTPGPAGLRDAPIVIVTEPHRTPLALCVIADLEIGRDCNGLILLDAAISRRHLSLHPVDGDVFVSDLGSLNGSTIDGLPLPERRQLSGGEVIRFGSCTLALATSGSGNRRQTPQTMIGRSSDPKATDPKATDPKATSIGLLSEAVMGLNLCPISSSAGDAGTVTIVFTDIEGSTQRAVELGDLRWHEVLAVHNQIMRGMLARHGGTETHSLGDGFMMCFRSARSALSFITDAQRALAAYETAHPLAGLRVRAGLHTGEAVLGDDGDLFGQHVIMASRIADQAKGGEILVSSLVREIVEPRGDIVFGESRTIPLKGLNGEHRVHRIRY